MIVGLILVACSADSVSTLMATEPTVFVPTLTTLPTVTPEAEPAVVPLQNEGQIDPDFRIRIVTNSDWTVLSLVNGVSMDNATMLSSSVEADTANYEDGVVRLAQPISQAEAGVTVEAVADLFFREGSLSESLEFVIDRGHIGETTVEIFSFGCNEPTLVETFTWKDIQPYGENLQSFTLDADRITAPTQNEYTVIAQLNFWYYGPGEHGGFEGPSGQRLTPLTPLLGETYWASDPEVVYQQIEWASEYGVDAFSIEWTTPRGIGCCGSMENTLDDVFLRSRNIRKVRWVIFYDFVLRLDQTPGLKRHVGNLDFDEPAVFNTFVADMKHFAEKYFGNPQYLTIDGRPVIYIWATGAYSGNLEGAIRKAREEVANEGYDVFIVGDEVSADHFDAHHASLFDANTTFTFLIGGLDFSSWQDLGNAIPEVDQTFEAWRSKINDLQVFGREETVNFQPAWAPQYDDRYFIAGGDIYVPATSKEQVVAMAEVARKHAEPVGSQGQKLIWLNTWNNWAETTTIEPTADLGPKYPAGNYQFDMLEVVREVFGSDTFSCPTP
jgi:hypothetical protein